MTESVDIGRPAPTPGPRRIPAQRRVLIIAVIGLVVAALITTAVVMAVRILAPVTHSAERVEAALTAAGADDIGSMDDHWLTEERWWRSKPILVESAPSTWTPDCARLADLRSILHFPGPVSDLFDRTTHGWLGEGGYGPTGEYTGLAALRFRDSVDAEQTWQLVQTALARCPKLDAQTPNLERPGESVPFHFRTRQDTDFVRQGGEDRMTVVAYEAWGLGLPPDPNGWRLRLGLRDNVLTIIMLTGQEPASTVPSLDRFYSALD